MSLAVQVPLVRTDFGAAPATGLQVQSISLMRDYYLTGPWVAAGITLGNSPGLVVVLDRPAHRVSVPKAGDGERPRSTSNQPHSVPRP